MSQSFPELKTVCDVGATTSTVSEAPRGERGSGDTPGQGVHPGREYSTAPFREEKTNKGALTWLLQQPSCERAGERARIINYTGFSLLTAPFQRYSINF